MAEIPFNQSGPAASAIALNFQWAKREIVLANGNNDDIDPQGANYIRITGPSAAFAMRGFAGGLPGMPLVLEIVSAQTATISHQSAGSSGINRIITSTAADVAVTGPCTFVLVYDDTVKRWFLIKEPIDAAATIASLRTLGTGALQAAAGNHNNHNPRALAVSAGFITVNTTGETDILSKSVTGGTLGTNGFLRGFCDYVWLHDGTLGQISLTWRLKYGATTVATAVHSVDNPGDSNFHLAWLQFMLMATGATNSQWGDIHAYGPLWASPVAGPVEGQGSAAEDSTAAKTLKLTLQLSGASAGHVYALGVYATLEYMAAL